MYKQNLALACQDESKRFALQCGATYGRDAIWHCSHLC